MRNNTPCIRPQINIPTYSSESYCACFQPNRDYHICCHDECATSSGHHATERQRNDFYLVRVIWTPIQCHRIIDHEYSGTSEIMDTLGPAILSFEGGCPYLGGRIASYMHSSTPWLLNRCLQLAYRKFHQQFYADTL